MVKRNNSARINIGLSIYWLLTLVGCTQQAEPSEVAETFIQYKERKLLTLQERWLTAETKGDKMFWLETTYISVRDFDVDNLCDDELIKWLNKIKNGKR